MNVPNMITVFRLCLIPIFIFVFFSGIHNSLVFSIFIFLIAGASDVLDGHIARKYNIVTKVGTVLDPLADKLMLLTVLSCLTIKGYIPILVVAIVAGKDLFMILSGIFLYKKGVVIPSNIIGKISTLFFYISILIFTFNKTIGIYLLYISAICALVALVNYFIVYFKGKKTKK